MGEPRKIYAAVTRFLAVLQLLLMVLVVSVESSRDPELTELKTVYDYFSDGGIQSGLEANRPDYFLLNGKPIRILSGSLHYFRVHPDHWRDRLRKFRAAGLNAIDVYSPWNLHEPQKDVFDFGDGDHDFSAFLNVTRFLEMAREEDLLVILRPGPYICSEWDFGGLPSWLLHDHPMFVRTSYDKYIDRVNRYLTELLSAVKHLQFHTKTGPKGGPIIMVQIENEYGAFGYDDQPRDKTYLGIIRDIYLSNGIESLLFTSDSPKQTQDLGALPDVLMTANFKYEVEQNLDKLKQLQPNKPMLVSEFWPGWFDHWFEGLHNTLSVQEFEALLSTVFSYNASVNFYMFHGGTNFGFMNGANVIEEHNVKVFPYYAPDVTSYDYDAPLTEAGHYTAKYDSAARMVLQHDPLASILIKPPRPEIVPARQYADVAMDEYLDFEDILCNVDEESIEKSFSLKSMEELSMNNGSGQSYGYILYRTFVPKAKLKTGSSLTIRGHVRDLLQIRLNGIMINEPILSVEQLSQVGSWAVRDSSLKLNLDKVPSREDTDHFTLDLLVENLGRNNFGRPHDFNQKKGIWEGPVLLNSQPINGWKIVPLEFKRKWVQRLSGWKPRRPGHPDDGPKVLRGFLQVVDSVPRDTYFDFGCSPDCKKWLHGCLFINGFNVGRYHTAGPTQTLYIPGPLLKKGSNEILIMEFYSGGSNFVKFTDLPYLGPEA